MEALARSRSFRSPINDGRGCAAAASEMGSKKQQTFAKLQRERRVKEKRQLKQEKKQAAAARKLEAANTDPNSTDFGDDENAASEALPSPPE
jgi:hypothetical protein